MIVESSVSGFLPRPQWLINETRKFDRHRITKETLDAAFIKSTKEVIKAQEDNDLSFVNDGYLKQQDLLRPFTNKIRTVQVGQLYRWFDNNTFYRKPFIQGKLVGFPPFTETFLDLLEGKRLKAILPAPYTYCKLSSNEFYEDEEKLLFDFAEILRDEIEFLEKQGYEYIQLSDPALVFHKTLPDKDDLRTIGKAIELLAEGTNARICLQTFFGDVSPILSELLEWKVDDIGIDFYESDFENIKEYSFTKGVSLGLVNARNTLKENPTELIDICQELLSYSNPERLVISTNCDLDFLTWDTAKSKITTVTTIEKKLKGELS
jgi:5-methyltetrahydropteroyltriglutamate--homocysteine methyltransferase